MNTEEYVNELELDLDKVRAEVTEAENRESDLRKVLEQARDFVEQYQNWMNSDEPHTEEMDIRGLAEAIENFDNEPPEGGVL